MNDIERLTDRNLLEHFTNVVIDDHYGYTRNPRNDSGFTFEELENEILRRMGFMPLI